MSLPVLNNESVTLCGPCGGACCKSMPGSAMPEDFGAPNRDVMRERISAALASGRWAIDWYEGDPTDGDADSADYMRPATKGKEGRKRDGSWGGACTFHGPMGCALAFEARPWECRMLEPSAGKTCALSTGKSHVAIAWMPYADILGDM